MDLKCMLTISYVGEYCKKKDDEQKCNLNRQPEKLI